MIFFDTRKLADRLKSNEVPQVEQFKYFVAEVALLGIGSLSNRDYPHDLTDLLISLVQLVVEVFVLIACFRVNRQGDGRMFLERLICIAWPIAMRCTLIFAVVNFICEHFALSGGNILSHLLEASLYAIPIAIFYWMLFKNIQYISKI
jgi:hypothetical protein